MGLWHCPHCGTPQAEAARCWVCRRSSTTCRTCRSFRSAVAGGLGYCALDRRRSPLRGDEVKGCWEGPDLRHAVAGAPVTLPPPVDGLGWTEVARTSGSAQDDAAARDTAPRTDAGTPRGPRAIDPPPLGLWGEIEP